MSGPAGAPPSIAQSFEGLVQWAMTADHQADVVAARAEYSAATGEVFDEDRQLELRLAGFLEFYLCDRVAPWAQSTPAQARYRQALKADTASSAAIWRAFTQTWHGLFSVLELLPGRVRLIALGSKSEVEVTERRAMHGLTVGDVLEARLIPFQGTVGFSTAWVWHPHAAAPAIIAEAERRRTGGERERDLVFDCARRALRVDRYRQIAIEKIYDFSVKPA
jgi:hypothetical protein